MSTFETDPLSLFEPEQEYRPEADPLSLFEPEQEYRRGSIVAITPGRDAIERARQSVGDVIARVTTNRLRRDPALIVRARVVCCGTYSGCDN